MGYCWSSIFILVTSLFARRCWCGIENLGVSSLIEHLAFFPFKLDEIVMYTHQYWQCHDSSIPSTTAAAICSDYDFVSVKSTLMQHPLRDKPTDAGREKWENLIKFIHGMVYINCNCALVFIVNQIDLFHIYYGLFRIRKVFRWIGVFIQLNVLCMWKQVFSKYSRLINDNYAFFVHKCSL